MEIRYQWIGVVGRREFAFGTSRFKAKACTPKTYEKVAVFEVPDLRNDYNDGLFRVYRTKNKHYVVSTYRDGCFYEQFATAEFDEEALKMLGLETK